MNAGAAQHPTRGNKHIGVHCRRGFGSGSCIKPLSMHHLGSTRKSAWKSGRCTLIISSRIWIMRASEERNGRGRMDQGEDLNLTARPRGDQHPQVTAEIRFKTGFKPDRLPCHRRKILTSPWSSKIINTIPHRPLAFAVWAGKILRILSKR